MTITAQDYINLVLVLFVYGTAGILLIGFSAFVVNKFWVDPISKLNKHIIAEQDNHQDAA